MTSWGAITAITVTGPTSRMRTVSKESFNALLNQVAGPRCKPGQSGSSTHAVTHSAVHLSTWKNRSCKITVLPWLMTSDYLHVTEPKDPSMQPGPQRQWLPEGQESVWRKALTNWPCLLVYQKLIQAYSREYSSFINRFMTIFFSEYILPHRTERNI